MEALGLYHQHSCQKSAAACRHHRRHGLRQTSASDIDGTYQIYDIGNNGILANYQLGQVDPLGSLSRSAAFNDGDTTTVVAQRPSGAFQVYDIVNNNITG